MGYKVTSLKDIYRNIGEDETKCILKDFECALNKDVEYFIKEKAIEFAKQDIAETFIVTSSYKKKEVIVGYFSFATKVVKMKRNTLTGKKKKRFCKFAEYDEENHCFFISLPLIGQLGKNYKNEYNKLITGDVLLKLACDKMKEAQEILGGRFIFLECEDKTVLREFYERNGFVCFGKRNLEKDERDKNAGEYLLQMLCDLSNY